LEQAVLPRTAYSYAIALPLRGGVGIYFSPSP
jgi:hypothetical protein